MGGVAFRYFRYGYGQQLAFVHGKCRQSFRHLVALVVDAVLFKTIEPGGFYHFGPGDTVWVDAFALGDISGQWDRNAGNKRIAQRVDDGPDTIASCGIYDITAFGIGSYGLG